MATCLPYKTACVSIKYVDNWFFALTVASTFKEVLFYTKILPKICNYLPKELYMMLQWWLILLLSNNNHIHLQ